MKPWQALRLVFHFIRAVVNPKNVDHAIRISDVLREANAFDVSVARLKSAAGGRAFFETRSKTFRDDREYFAACPEGSLGLAYHRFLEANGLDPTKLPDCDGANEATHLVHVMRKTHDIFHTVTGFDSSIGGELGIQAFMAKQYNWPFAMIGIAGGCMVTLFREPSKIGEIIDSIGRGWALGSSAEPLVLVDWNRHWETPLADLRRQLNIH